MNILKTLVLSSVILTQGTIFCSNEEENKPSTLNQNIKTGLIISAIPAVTWAWTALKHNVTYIAGENDLYTTDLSVRRPFLKLLKPDRIEIGTQDVFTEGCPYPVAKRWWVKEYVIEATDTNIERLGKVDFEHKLGKAFMRTSLGVASVLICKGLYDSYKEYRNGNFIKEKKKA